MKNKYWEAKENFWNLISKIRENEEKIPKKILEKVKDILAKVEAVMLCSSGRVDYKSALCSLKKVLEENYEKFPK